MVSTIIQLRNLKSPLVNRYRSSGDRNRDLRNWDEAASNYKLYLALQPADFAIWVQLGHALKEARRPEEALAAYQTALELDPYNADLLLNLGHYHKVMGNRALSSEFFRRSYAIDFNEAALQEITDGPINLPKGEIERRRRDRLHKRAASGMSLRRPSIIGSIDHVDGWDVHGWVFDAHEPESAPEVAIFANGNLVGTVTPSLFRPGVDAGDFGSALTGVQQDVDIDFSHTAEVEISARLVRNGQELNNSPIKTSAPPHLRKWLRRKAELKGDELALLQRRADEAANGKTLSIIMPVYNTKPEWLSEAITSVLDQWCNRWQLICIDDKSTKAETREIILKYAEKDKRITPIFLSENMGIASTTNIGIKASTGDYIGFMDHDDYLEPDAVFRMLESAFLTNADLIYSDEAITSKSINRIRHIISRPAFSYDYYLSHPYFVHFVCVRADIAKAIGGLDPKMKISADVDFVLRSIEASEIITHVPAVLYRWRTHQDSAGHMMAHRVTEATVDALNRHLDRSGFGTNAVPGFHFNNYRINFFDRSGKCAIIIPTKNKFHLMKECIESIIKTCSPAEYDLVIVDHDSNEPESIEYFDSIRDKYHIVPYNGKFNYSIINNYAVSQLETAYDFFVFMNNDVEAITPGWLSRMRSICQRKDVGVVGATLLYPDETIQHSGVVVGLGTIGDHAHKNHPFNEGGKRNPGYNSSLTSLRDYSAVTGACMMIRAEIFRGVGGFDPQLEVGFNDTDLCLRIGRLGYRILCAADVVLYHHESISRKETKQVEHPEDGMRFANRWATLLEKGDIFYNPLLNQNAGMDHRPGSLDNAWHPARMRFVRPKLLPLSEGTPESVDRAIGGPYSLAGRQQP